MKFDDRESIERAWLRLAKPAQRSLELAHVALRCGGLAVGSVLVNQEGIIIAEGRNRAYDPGGGNEFLQGTPIAHAELNVLAAVNTNRDLRTDTLWSTVQPCSMCDAALAFLGAGAVRWLAPDPSAFAEGVSTDLTSGNANRIGPENDHWRIVSAVLFLASIALRQGLDHPTIIASRRLEPETAMVIDRLFESENRAWTAAALPGAFGAVWDTIIHATTTRRARRPTTS